MLVNSAAKRLRELLSENEYVAAPGVYNAMDAWTAQLTGNDAVYMSGAATNIGVYRLFDGHIGLAEKVSVAKQICDAVEAPVVVDADTGHGGTSNVQRTVREFEKAGVAGLHIEDQSIPKTCGLMKGSRVDSREAATGRIEAALDAKQDEDTFVIARTDANHAVNGGWEEAVERGRIFADLGADLVMPSLDSTDKDDFVRYASEIHETHPEARFLGNLASSVKWTEEDDPITFEDFGKHGYTFIILPLFGLHATAHATYEHFSDLAENGEEAAFRMEDKWKEHDAVADHSEVMRKWGNFEDYKRVEEAYSDNTVDWGID